ncbi:MAG: hypothetical protein CH104c_0622 [Candidatus Woesebacteria bacterium]|jgi:uncharacterized protein YerC|nr:MAG: hypothetical protein CH104c_0622 [Candidatus Woesebacteria bacterium]
MRVSRQKLNPILREQIIKTFAQVIADLKDIKEAILFLNDFFMENELEAFAKRLAVGYWLKKGRSYSNIRDNLKVSSATIADVAFMYKNKGFDLGLKKIEAEEWATIWADKIKKITGSS